MRQYTGGLWTFGRIIDRYATNGYGPEMGTLETIALAGESGLLSGLDLNYPFDPGVTVEDVAAAMSAHGLSTVCITPVIYDRSFRSGSFSSADAGTRRRVVDLAHESVDVATRLGARYVKFWPGQDGYDYPFQVDYVALRRNTVETMREVVTAHPDVQFAIEYKLKEPRNRLIWSTAATTLLLIDEIGADNVGVVVDFGHSLFAKENPAEALSLVHARGRLVDIEVDDNYREWDDDLTAGALHIVETLEFLHVTRLIGWEGAIKLDLFPYRESATDAVRESVETLVRLEELAATLPMDELQAAQDRHDAMAVTRIVRTALLR